MTEKIFYGFGRDKNFESADKQKIKISILLDKKTVFIFSCETNFLTEILSQFEKLFLTQRKMKTIFSPFYFSFSSDNRTAFLVDTNF